MREIPVTNDAAERGVKNAQEVKSSAFSTCDREKLMLIKNEHRRKHTKLDKQSLKHINK